MTSLLKRLVIYDQNGKNATEITDDERITVKIAVGAKGSTINIILKNAFAQHVSNSEFMYSQNNIIKLWCKWATEGTDTLSTSSDLLMAADVIDVEATGEENSSVWSLSCMDRTFIILNKLWSKNYSIADGLSCPDLIKQIINVTTGSGTGTLGTNLKADLTQGTWSSGTFTRTGGGYIQHVRPDNSAFPSVAVSKVFKPVYEWIDNLSQIDMTNTSTEVAASGSPPAALPYYFYIDENNNCHWEYPESNTSSAHHMTWGTNSAVSPDTTAHYIISFKLKRSVFDIVNMVIFNAGVDYYGSGILDYYYNQQTTSAQLKPVYRPMIEVADKAIFDDIFDKNSTAYTENNGDADNAPGTLTYHGKRYDASYNFTPHWTTTEVTDDDELNDSLRDYASAQGKVKASNLCVSKGSPRWKGDITVRGEKFVIGDLIIFNSADHGIKDAYVRVKEITHNFSKDSWKTTLQVEEDPDDYTNA